MRPRPRFPRTDAPARWLLPALAVLVLGVGARPAAASPSVSSAPAFDAAEHARTCKCDRCRGPSCCCGHRVAAPRALSPAPAEVPARAESGPCLNSAPCHDPALPSAPPAGPFGKAAGLTPPGLIAPAADGPLHAADARCVFPPRRAARLDEPPESLPSA